MIALWIVLAIVVLFCILIFFGSAKIRISYNGKPDITASVAGIRFRILPQKVAADGDHGTDLADCKNPDRILRKELKRQKKIAAKLEKKRRKAAKKEAKRLRNLEKQPIPPVVPAPNLKENLQMILALVKKLYRETGGRLHIRIDHCHISVGTDDVAKTAVLYGVCIQGVAALLELTKSGYPHTRYKTEDISVTPDYLSEKSSADLLVICSVRLFRLIGIGLRMLMAYNREKQRAQEKAIRRVKNSLRDAR